MSEILNIITQFFNETVSPLVSVFNSFSPEIKGAITAVTSISFVVIGLKALRRWLS